MATSITVGNIPACQRPARIATAVRSVLATLNRSVSCGSRTNARTTRTPVICSRRSLLTSSMRTCMARKLGTIRLMMNPMAMTSTGTATASSQDRPRFSRMAISTPPTIMIGAATISVQLSRTSICTCWTSLVSRVISDGAPKSCTSRWENAPTRWKMAARTSRPKLIDVRAENQTAAIEQHDLQQGDAEHDRAGVHDVCGVAGRDALVDDVGVQARQVERGDGADELQGDDHPQPGLVGLEVGADESDQHQRPALDGGDLSTPWSITSATSAGVSR